MIFDLGLEWLVFLLVASALAGFVDSIAGGGGLISLPAYLLAGIPVHMALGTNKLGNTIGTLMACINFVRHKKVNFSLVIIALPFVLVGAFGGAKAAQWLDSQTIAMAIVLLLPVGMLATLLPKKPRIDVSVISFKKMWLILPFFGVFMGFYDGVFGPGAGSFLALGLHLLLAVPLLQASANARMLNLISNAGALLGFLLGGKVMLGLGLSMAATNVIGNYLGSHLAIKRGDAVVKWCLFGVFLFLLGTLVVKYLGSS